LTSCCCFEANITKLGLIIKRKKNRFAYNRAQYRLGLNFNHKSFSYFFFTGFDDFRFFLSTITVDQKVKMGEEKVNKK